MFYTRSYYTMLVNSQSLAQRATREYQFVPCVWLRGLVPRDWTIGQVPEPPEEEQQFSWGTAYLEQPYQLSEGVIISTDASGGDHSSDPRLRR
eukprot:12468594-Heterocapsa_arctica.AAC.1